MYSIFSQKLLVETKRTERKKSRKQWLAKYKAELLFLKCILKKVNTLNVEFQTGHFRLHLLNTIVSCEYIGILLKEAALISLNLSDIWITLRITGIWMAFTTLHKNHIDGDFGRFKRDCIKLLIKLCYQINLCLPLNENSVEYLIGKWGKMPITNE